MANELTIPSAFQFPSTVCTVEGLHLTSDISSRDTSLSSPRQIATKTMTTMADFENYRSTFNSHETGGAASNMPLWSKGVSLLNSSLSAFNGISATLRALQQDKANNDQMYKGTMNTMLSNIAVTSSSFGVGSLLAGVAATLLGGSLILPAAIGAAAGLGTAFVIDGTVRRLDPSITR